MKKLYFLRHGLSEFNVQRRWAGISDTPLVDEGRAQAKKAGQGAKDLQIDLIVCSPLSRAHETARIFAEEIGYPVEDIVLNPILIERNYGALEGEPHAGDIDLDGIVDLETDEPLVVRAQQALDWINSFDADHILIVSHGSFGRAIRSLVKAEYPMSHPEKIPNAELQCWVEED